MGSSFLGGFWSLFWNMWLTRVVIFVETYPRKALTPKLLYSLYNAYFQKAVVVKNNYLHVLEHDIFPVSGVIANWLYSFSFPSKERDSPFQIGFCVS